MARRQPDSCNFCAMAHAMLRLLARPKITAVFCESLTSASGRKVISNQFSDLNKTRKVSESLSVLAHALPPAYRDKVGATRDYHQIAWHAVDAAIFACSVSIEIAAFSRSMPSRISVSSFSASLEIIPAGMD